MIRRWRERRLKKLEGLHRRYAGWESTPRSSVRRWNRSIRRLGK